MKTKRSAAEIDVAVTIKCRKRVTSRYMYICTMYPWQIAIGRCFQPNPQRAQDCLQLMTAGLQANELSK